MWLREDAEYQDEKKSPLTVMEAYSHWREGTAVHRLKPPTLHLAWLVLPGVSDILGYSYTGISC